MSKSGYTPMPGSVAWKTIQFLTTNPDESLTTDDVAAKFDKPRSQVHSFLAQPVEAGILTRSEDSAVGDLVYRLGKGHPSIKPEPAAHPTLTRAGAEPFNSDASRPKRRSAESFIDTSAVVVERDVPLPNRNSLRATDWVGLLERLNVNDSVKLPIRCRSSLQKCANAYAKANAKEFSVRRIDDENLRIWRTA